LTVGEMIEIFSKTMGLKYISLEIHTIFIVVHDLLVKFVGSTHARKSPHWVYKQIVGTVF